MRQLTFENEGLWLAWRNLGLGGSDAPVIAGVSRFQRPFDLWLLKTGKRKPPKTSAVQKHGKDNEAKARDAYSVETGNFMPPVNCMHDEIMWLRCSLDGYDASTNTILEVKVPWDIGTYLTCKEGQVPDEYWPQVQHCLAVSGAVSAHFWVWFEGQGVLLKVDFDPAYWNDELFPLEQEFWGYVTSGEFPLPKGKEDKTNDTKWMEVEEKVYSALAMRQVAEDRLRAARAQLERLAKAQTTRGRLIEATWEHKPATVVQMHTRSESLGLSLRRIK